MQCINGYKFATEQGAINARVIVNQFYGVPKLESDVTHNWVDYRCANLNTPQFWYIQFDSSLTPILGNPTTFDIVTPPFPQ
jgi:hypothetical protein